MTTITVTFSLDVDGKLVLNSVDRHGNPGHHPMRVKVSPGDQVVWTSKDADVVVSFLDNNPFMGNGVFTAKKGTVTASATVKSDVALHKSFFCNVTLGDKQFTNTTGVDTPGPN